MKVLEPDTLADWTETNGMPNCTCFNGCPVDTVSYYNYYSVWPASQQSLLDWTGTNVLARHPPVTSGTLNCFAFHYSLCQIFSFAIVCFLLWTLSEIDLGFSDSKFYWPRIDVTS